MLVKSYQFTGIDFGHLGQVVRNNMKQKQILENGYKADKNRYVNINWYFTLRLNKLIFTS